MVVVATAKVQIFKQITTVCNVSKSSGTLLLLPQRYKFSSKSQLLYRDIIICYVVVATAKVQIFKQITTGSSPVVSANCCCCYRKGTNFQANHNINDRRESTFSVVVATAKVQIFKQITTGSNPVVSGNCCCCYRKGTNFQANHNCGKCAACVNRLLLLPQRYKFSSKSQLKPLEEKTFRSCCCYRKGTNFQANHNWRCFRFCSCSLLLLPQRYKFSSKSQLRSG